MSGGAFVVDRRRDVPVQRLDQQRPGRLGAFTRRMADEGVSIAVLYSDHANPLILVVDDIEVGRRVSEEWRRARVGAPRVRTVRSAIDRCGAIRYVPSLRIRSQ